MPSNRWIDAGRTIEGSPAAAYLASVGAGSRRTVQQSMARLASMIAGGDGDPVTLRWEKLERTDTVKLRTELKEQFAPATANKMLSVLRGVLRACRDMGLMTEGAFQTAASPETVKATRPTRRVTVTSNRLAKLFASCATVGGAAGRRDAALLAVFLSSGMRRSEAVALDVPDYDASSGRLHIRGERPEHNRLVKLPEPARRAMSDWLEVRTDEPGPLLLPVDRGGLIRFRRMTDQAIYDIFGRIASRAGTPNLKLRDLRRAYVVTLIRSGKSIEDVRYLVGHASWITSASYRELASDKSIRAYALDELPYQSPTRSEK